MSDHEWRIQNGTIQYTATRTSVEKQNLKTGELSNLPLRLTSEGGWNFVDGDYEFAWSLGNNFVNRWNRRTGEERSALLMIE